MVVVVDALGTALLVAQQRRQEQELRRRAFDSIQCKV
jgi:hypothetical protein